jgi:hypothetical protein
MSPSREPLDESIAPEILAAISGQDLLVQHLGYWPRFHDFEVLSIVMERPLVSAAACALRATFLVFDVDKAHDDPERRQGTAELLFENVEALQINGFNYQNPIIGLSIIAAERQRFLVEWGGTAIQHEVSFTCGRVSVIRVVDLNPFRRSQLGW